MGQGFMHLWAFWHISYPTRHRITGSFFKGEMQFNKVEENIMLLSFTLMQGREKKKNLPKEPLSIKEEGR